MRVLVTGGAGFIGSALVRMMIGHTSHSVVNVDKLTYAGNLESLGSVTDDARYRFERADICDSAMLQRILETYQPEAVIHLAAESHVDRSIDTPSDFIQTNVTGTFTLLEAVRRFWERSSQSARAAFRFVHVSTDEVFGSLDAGDIPFSEVTPYDPSSPYAASKAGADHLARAWHRTYGLPTIVTNCSNNYGPFQFPEKLIPLTILNAIARRPLPVYGRGENIRDWLYVGDHARALLTVLEHGTPGETYAVGGNSQCRNLDVVTAVCDIVDEVHPDAGARRTALIQFVTDRPGHDLRYAIDCSKIQRELGWAPSESFRSGLRKTVEWYLTNQSWCEHVQSGSYRGERLGLNDAAGTRS